MGRGLSRMDDQRPQGSDIGRRLLHWQSPRARAAGNGEHCAMAVPALRLGALPGPTEANRRWWTLAGACMGLFVLMLDSTVINVALPDVARDLDATTAGLQWVVNAYLLVLAAFVVSAGRLGDVLGRRLVFVVGMSAFAGGSVVAAVSGSEEVLVARRVLQ